MNLPTELFHYAQKPIPFLENRPYLANPDHFMWCDEGMKPYGFWVSIEDFIDDQTWKSWCEGENFHKERLKTRHRIILKPHCNILVMKTHQELIDFSLKYSYHDPMEYSTHFKHSDKRPYVYRINWKTIKKMYDAIFIAPYIWNARLCSCATWYYCWDCASGCIWNMNIIESIHHDPILPADLLQTPSEFPLPVERQSLKMLLLQAQQLQGQHQVSLETENNPCPSESLVS